ncbi:putative ribonuclease H-like domain-containing protein [Tanacetum coccineum]
MQGNVKSKDKEVYEEERKIHLTSSPKEWTTIDDIDCPRKFDAEPVTYAMMALTGVEQDDWSIEFDAEHMHFGQDGLDDFDWSNKCWFGIESSNNMESDISSGDETLTDSTYENFKREKAYKAVPPPTGTIIPPRANIGLTSDDEETDVSEVKRKLLLTQRIVIIFVKQVQPNSVGHESRTRDLGTKGIIEYTQQYFLEVMMEVYIKDGYEDPRSHCYSPSSKGNPEEDLKEPMLSIDSGGYVGLWNMTLKVEEESQDKGIIKESCLDFDESLAMWKSSSLISYLFSNLVIKKPMFSSPDKECLILSPKFKFVVKDLVILRVPLERMMFEDHAHSKIYRVVKAVMACIKPPRAWYERLSTFLLKHGYRRGAIDKTLFIKKDRRDIMLVQVYVDDIIFGSTKSSMVKDFEDLMQKEFKMNEEGEDVDVHLYRSMIGCLMYLTASRPDIMFAVCLCARFQVTPKVSHLHAVKRIFRDIGYEGNLAQLTFSKPLFSPQWKYLVHVLLHCLVLKSTSWDTIRTNIASALVGLAHNQKFNFSLMILTGLLGHISNGTPFLMYPRITPLTPSMLEVVHELCSGGELSTSPHSRGCKFCMGCSRHSPTQSVLILNVLLQTWYCLLPIGMLTLRGLLKYKWTAFLPKKKRKWFDELKKTKRQRTSLREETTLLLTRKESNDVFLKRPPFKDFIPSDSEKRNGMMFEGRDAKGPLRKVMMTSGKDQEEWEIYIDGGLHDIFKVCIHRDKRWHYDSLLADKKYLFYQRVDFKDVYTWNGTLKTKGLNCETKQYFV